MSHRAAQLLPSAQAVSQIREPSRLHALASRDESGIAHQALFGVLEYFRALFEDAFHAGAGFARHLLAEKFADLSRRMTWPLVSSR
jgi:hypothetical protein